MELIRFNLLKYVRYSMVINCSAVPVKFKARFAEPRGLKKSINEYTTII